jgi:PTS system ascorbate-specific IIB component
MIKVFAVCGMGLGTSVILKSRLKKALDEAGADYSLEVTDASSASGQSADLIFTSDELADKIKNKDAKVYVIKSFTDRKEIGEKVQQALEDIDAN